MSNSEVAAASDGVGGWPGRDSYPTESGTRMVRRDVAPCPDCGAEMEWWWRSWYRHPKPLCNETTA